MKGNKIAIDRYLEAGEIVDSLDLSVNYLVKSTREGGTVPLPLINIITWSKVTANPSPSDLIEVTNTDTSINFNSVIPPSGYPYIYKIQGNLYTTIVARTYDAPNSIKYIVECSLPSVTSIGNFAFQGCSSLTTVNMPNATSTGNSTFTNCSSLTTVNMPNATSTGNSTFTNCSSLTTVNMPNATSIGQYAFFVCSSLTSIDLPNVTSIKMSAFHICSSLTSMVVGINTNQVATLGSTDAIPNTIQSIYVPDALVNDYKSATNWSSHASKIKGISERPTA